MTKGRAAMWVSLKTCAGALLLLSLFSGCGKTHTTESGETHFVTCDTDADCSSVNGAHSCDGGLCRGPANLTDSSATAAPACGGGCGDSECATPGSCSLASACTLVDCGSAIVDDNACVRPGCENDDGCPDDERCADIDLGRRYECVESAGKCLCTNGKGLFPLKICSPTKLSGARGTWRQIAAEDIVIGQSVKRTVTPDGAITIERNELRSPGIPAMSTAQLTTDDLDQLTRLINGTALRLDLVNEQDCPLTKETDYLVELTLDTTTIKNNIAGCLGSVASFQALQELLGKY